MLKSATRACAARRYHRRFGGSNPSGRAITRPVQNWAPRFTKLSVDLLAIRSCARLLDFSRCLRHGPSHCVIPTQLVIVLISSCLGTQGEAAMKNSFQVTGTNTKAPFTLKIHRGEGML